MMPLTKVVSTNWRPQMDIFIPYPVDLTMLSQVRRLMVF